MSSVIPLPPSPFDAWFQERIAFDDGCGSVASELYQDYLTWFRANSLARPMLRSTFNRAMSDRGVQLAGKNADGHKVYRGARLKRPRPLFQAAAPEEETDAALLARAYFALGLGAARAAGDGPLNGDAWIGPIMAALDRLRDRSAGS